MSDGTLLTPTVAAMIGVEGALEIACDKVEAGAVRRYAQAVEDDDAPLYEDAGGSPRGPAAPLLFPLHMFRRRFGESDPLSASAADPNYDGTTGTMSQGLPPLPVGDLTLLNGGLETEFFRRARHGESMTAQSRYLEITEKVSSKGPMLIVVVETEYRSLEGDPLLRVRRTQIRRPR